MPGLNLADVRRVPVPVPPLAEQDEIIRRVGSLLGFAESVASRLARAHEQVEKLTPTLLAKAFRGELVPQNPNDEPASVLLERIRAARAADAAMPKRPMMKRKEHMAPLTTEAVRSLIQQMPADRFTFDDLRKRLPSDYETLKDILFTLLGDSNSGLKQVFDSSAHALYLLRTKP